MPAKERCARCGRETEYGVNTPIDVRLYYVEGAGQLCADCWRKLYDNPMEVAIFDRRTNDS